MQSRRNTLLCHYRYDALDRLIANEQPSAPERQRFYCKSRLATEIQGVNRYSLLQHGDQILAQQQSEGNALSTTLLATDQQRSVLQTLNANQTRRPIAYTPYGHHRPENGLLSLLGFNGERPDPVTGCYLLGNGYRAFNPVLMRFNSPDSLSPFGKGGLNPYVYCLGDPISRRDPSGRLSTLVLTGISKWLDRARARLQLPNTAKANPLRNNIHNISIITNKPTTTSLKDMAYNATNKLLGNIPGKEIENLSLTSDLQYSGLKTWEKETGFNNLNVHLRYPDRNTFDFHIISAGIEGKLNGVTPGTANKFSQQIASGELPTTRTIKAFPTELPINIHQQREIYRQSGLALPYYFRPDLRSEIIRD